MQKNNRVIGARPFEPKERTFICDDDLRNGSHAGRPGFFVRILLPSYRALPLSCIERIELNIDGAPVEPKNMTLILNGYSHSLDALGSLSKIYWFILDKADLFIESASPISAGEHPIAGTMVIVEPYMTVGRFPFYYASEKRLKTAADL